MRTMIVSHPHSNSEVRYDCLQHSCSNYLSITAYPSLPDPPTDQTMRMMFAIARQEEPIVLRSNVQGSITGQVRVMWHFAGSAGTNMYSPNGDKNSLVLVNLTTADDGDYFPLATATRLKFVKGWTNQKGQTYRLHVDIFGELYYTNQVCWHAFFIRRATTIHEEFNL